MAKTEKKPGERSNERRSRGVATEGTPSPVPDTHRSPEVPKRFLTTKDSTGKCKLDY